MRWEGAALYDDGDRPQAAAGAAAVRQQRTVLAVATMVAAVGRVAWAAGAA